VNLRGRIPVEQLDDERVTNIERKLVVAVADLRAPAAPASRRVLAFAGIAIAVAVAAVAGYKLRPMEVAAPAPVAASIERPQQLALHGGTLDLGDAQLTSTPGTDAAVERTTSRTVVQMQRGTLDFAVTHDPRRVFVVRAGDTEIEDIGTKFRVEYDGIAAVTVSVSEGEVRVTRAGTSHNIAAGQSWTTAVTVTASAEPAPPASPPPSPVTPPPAPPKKPAATSAPKSNARLALERLAYEEPLDVGATDVNTAIAQYLDLAVSMGDAQGKTQVLYSMAVVQHRAHQDKAALYTLSGVIKRQGGKAYKAALWLNVRIECMQRFDDECRQAADLYLRRVPDGPAAGVAQAILDEIHRG
jgi:hypothetical protein